MSIPKHSTDEMFVFGKLRDKCVVHCKSFGTGFKFKTFINLLWYKVDNSVDKSVRFGRNLMTNSDSILRGYQLINLTYDAASVKFFTDNFTGRYPSYPWIIPVQKHCRDFQFGKLLVKRKVRAIEVVTNCKECVLTTLKKSVRWSLIKRVIKFHCTLTLPRFENVNFVNIISSGVRWHGLKHK